MALAIDYDAMHPILWQRMNCHREPAGLFQQFLRQGLRFLIRNAAVAGNHRRFLPKEGCAGRGVQASCIGAVGDMLFFKGIVFIIGAVHKQAIDAAHENSRLLTGYTAKLPIIPDGGGAGGKKDLTPVQAVFHYGLERTAYNTAGGTSAHGGQGLFLGVQPTVTYDVVGTGIHGGIPVAHGSAVDTAADIAGGFLLLLDDITGGTAAQNAAQSTAAGAVDSAGVFAFGDLNGEVPTGMEKQSPWNEQNQ